MPLRLTMAFSNNQMVAPLKEGIVKPKNIDLEFVTIEGGSLFFRNLKYDEFDVSEMGIPWTVRGLEMNVPGRWDWGKLPVFLSRGTGWVNLYVNTASGIEHPRDLKGKRICVPEYNMSVCMWLRVMLKDLYGIQPSDNIWFNGRTRDQHQGGALGLEEDTPPQGVELHWLTADQTAEVMLDQGELDAAVISAWPPSPEAIDRYGGTPITGNPRLRKLFPDNGKEFITEFFRRTGAFQMNHHVIVQNRILREHPWVAMELFNAFQSSKEVAYERARKVSAGYLYFPSNAFQEQVDIFGEDPYPLGIRAMRNSFDKYIEAMLDSGAIKTPIAMDQVYYPTTLDT